MLTKQDEQVIIILSLCLTLVDYLQRQEKVKSAKWNRLQSLVEGFNKVSETWGFDSIFAPDKYKKAENIGDEVLTIINRRIYGKSPAKRDERGRFARGTE